MRCTLLRYVRTCDHEGISITITVTNISTTTSTSPRSSSSSSRRHQQRYQKWQAHKNVVLFFGLYCCHDSLEHQVSSTIAFCELRLVAAHFKVHGELQLLFNALYFLGHSFANKVMNQRLHLHMFAASGVHSIIIPPLRSTEAPDATRPSLSVGLFSSHSHRVSRLGGPELTRPMLLLQLRK